MSLDSVKLLESKVGEFLRVHGRVQQTCSALQEQVKEQEKRLAEAASQLKQFEKERDEIRTRLDRVLKRLADLDLK